MIGARQPEFTRTTVQFCCVLAVCFAGCNRKGKAGQAAGRSNAGSLVDGGSLAAKQKFGCKSHGTSFSMGTIEESNETSARTDGDAADDEDLGEDVPFGVTLGQAVSHPGGFIVPAVDSRKGGGHAVLALVDQAVASGRILDLGRVYGDAEPPRVVVRGDSAFVVAPDTDASGNSYRYGWVRQLETARKPEWLGSFARANGDSAVFALASADTTIVLAWDEIEPKTRRSYVRWVSLDGSGARRPVGATGRSGASKREPDRSWAPNVTDVKLDAEGPQLVPHAGGYWLAYLVASPHIEPSNGAKSSSPAGTREKDSGAGDEVRAVELGQRGIDLLPLDRYGSVNGKPIAVAERSAHVVTYDLEATSDGGAIVAYRDADTGPGVEAQVIEIVRVHPDGTTGRHRIDDERVGAGIPQLLVEATGKTGSASQRPPWISVAGIAGDTQLAELPERGVPVLELFDARQIAGVDPMVRRGDSLLVARHRARLVELELFDCAWSGGPGGPTPPPP